MRARVGGASTTSFLLAAHFAKRNTKFGGGGKKLESESEGGQKFLPPNPLPFCPPERSVFCSAFGGAISRTFVQKRFELRSAIAKIKIWAGERADRLGFSPGPCPLVGRRTSLGLAILSDAIIETLTKPEI